MYHCGFGAEYGGRILPLDLKTREAIRPIRRFGIRQSFPVKACWKVHYPSPRHQSSASFLVTGKHSYLDQTSPKLYDYATRIPWVFRITTLISMVNCHSEPVEEVKLIFDSALPMVSNCKISPAWIGNQERRNQFQINLLPLTWSFPERLLIPIMTLSLKELDDAPWKIQ